MFSSSRRISPERRAPGMSSLSRLIDRRKVDFPQPDGPMRAVTARGAIERLMSNSAWVFPYQKSNRSTSMRPVATGRLADDGAGCTTALIRTAR
jgi:hypothetical protein